MDNAINVEAHYPQLNIAVVTNSFQNRLYFLLKISKIDFATLARASIKSSKSEFPIEIILG